MGWSQGSIPWEPKISSQVQVRILPGSPFLLQKNNLNINNSMRLHEIEFKSERDFEDWLKRKQDRYEKYKRQEFNRQNKFKDSPFWRGFYAGKEVVPKDTIDKN
jgi:hypothetical protein